MPRIRFAVIGINHAHIHGMIDAIASGGGELVSFHAAEPDLAAEFARLHPVATRVADERAILEDASIQLVLSSIVPTERAPLGGRVMQHGKDFLADKPGILTREQLASFNAFHPLGRNGRPGDVTQAVLFLADEERSGWITGVVLPVDGGVTAGRN